MSWSNTTATTITYTSGATGTTISYGTDPSVNSYGWENLSAFSSPRLDIGVDFVLRADDEHGIYAFDDFRGSVATDGPLGTPP